MVVANNLVVESSQGNVGEYVGAYPEEYYEEYPEEYYEDYVDEYSEEHREDVIIT